jgi:uncharacterized iron-regulated protein
LGARKSPDARKGDFLERDFGYTTPMKILTTALLILTAANANAAEITAATLETLPSADVVILGEVHDNPVQHQNQSRAVAALKPAALVFEMLTPEQAGNVTDINRRNEQSLFTALGWEGSGWPDFSMYYPIFTAAPEARIFGMALDRPTVRRAVKEGAAEVYSGDAAQFELDQPLPEAERIQREQGQMEAHCNALPETLVGGMVEAQRLRDAVFAATVLKAHAATNGPVVVITGNGHARSDWGIPAALKRAAPDLNVLSIGQFEVEPWESGVPFDLYLLTAATEREDPCAAFK